MVPGKGYYVTNPTCGTMMTDSRQIKCQDGKLRPIFSQIRFEPAQDIPIDFNENYNGRTIHLWRFGGFGDVMWFAPIVRALKRLWPECIVNIVCGLEYQCALIGMDVKVSTMPLAKDQVKRGDAAFFFEGTVENSDESEHIHALDLFAQKVGVDLLDDRHLEWHTTEGEYWEARERFPRNRKPRVGIQVAASSPVRSYHPAMLSLVVSQLNDLGIESYLFGRPGQLEFNMEGAVNLSKENLTMRQSVAVLQTCDACLVPDSSLFHVAQALSIPTVALFGSFKASLRVTNPSKCRIIEAKGECAPCFFHSMPQTQFPLNKPCTHANFCTVLAAIPPERIVNELLDLLGLKGNIPTELAELDVAASD